MENDVVREDSESTQRKAWSAAEAAAFPALGIHPAPAAPSRVPRSSVSPPSSETVVSPAPQFREAGDDLDGIVELSSSMLEDDGDTGLHKIEMLAEDLVEEVPDEVEELPNSELIEEVDSGLLAYVETRGEISEKHHAVPAAADVSKVALASLHESLHGQAVASGMLSYSTGVPVHDLDSGASASRTLQIHRRSDTGRSNLIKNLIIGGVFLCGIGAGVYFGLPSEPASAVTSQPETTPLHAASALSAEAGDDASAVAERAREIEPQTAAPAEPTVAPLVVEPLVEQPIVVEPLVEEPADEAAPDQGDTDIQVRPLGDAEAAAMPSEPEMVVRPLEIRSRRDDSESRTTKSGARRSARSKGADDRNPTLGSSTTGDPGVLMLAAKPPCDILIDGKKTGLKTPQRVLRLPPGKHKVTLVNREHKLRDSFRVSIQSGKKTKVVRDMTSKIK